MAVDFYLMPNAWMKCGKNGALNTVQYKKHILYHSLFSLGDDSFLTNALWCLAMPFY